jgi:thiol-disulfide isomerase/thioredoxin
MKFPPSICALLAFFLSPACSFAEPYVCTEDIIAFNPANPSEALGQFKSGTKLEIGKPASTDGMVNVTFLSPDGKFIAAIVRAEDVGKAPKSGKPAVASNVPVEKSGFSKSSVYKQIQFDLTDAGGGTASPKKLAASKYVLIYFSAHWCPPCRKFTPKLVEFYNRNRDKNIEVVFVSSDNSAGEMSGYMKEAGMPWVAVKHAGGASSYLKSQFGGNGIPCLVLLDEGGQVLSHSYVNGEYVGPSKVLNDLQQKL